MIALVHDGFTDGDRLLLMRRSLRQRMRLLADRARHVADPSQLQSEIDRHVRALVVVGQLLPAQPRKGK